MDDRAGIYVALGDRSAAQSTLEEALGIGAALPPTRHRDKAIGRVRAALAKLR
jgi:hypothetical protein